MREGCYGLTRLQSREHGRPIEEEEEHNPEGLPIVLKGEGMERPQRK